MYRAGPSPLEQPEPGLGESELPPSFYSPRPGGRQPGHGAFTDQGALAKQRCAPGIATLPIQIPDIEA